MYTIERTTYPSFLSPPAVYLCVAKYLICKKNLLSVCVRGCFSYSEKRLTGIACQPCHLFTYNSALKRGKSILRVVVIDVFMGKRFIARDS